MDLVLGRNEMLSIRGDARGLSVSCQEGALWLTQPGDPEDHILEASDAFTVSRTGTVVVWARERSSLKIVEWAEPASARISWPPCWGLSSG